MTHSGKSRRRIATRIQRSIVQRQFLSWSSNREAHKTHRRARLEAQAFMANYFEKDRKIWDLYFSTNSDQDTNPHLSRHQAIFSDVSGQPPIALSCRLTSRAWKRPCRYYRQWKDTSFKPSTSELFKLKIAHCVETTQHQVTYHDKEKR